MTPERGEVWVFDLGMAAKVRPVLIISVAYGDLDRAVLTVVPYTTSLRGSRFEIPVSAGFLKPGAFLAQGLATHPNVDAVRRLGRLSDTDFKLVFDGVLRWLGYNPA